MLSTSESLKNKKVKVGCMSPFVIIHTIFNHMKQSIHVDYYNFNLNWHDRNEKK